MTTCHCTSRLEVPFDGFKVEGHMIHTPRACYHASLFPDLWDLRSSGEAPTTPEALMRDPSAAKIADLVETVRKFDAGTMKLGGRDAAGKLTFLCLVAVDEEAERLDPIIERLTDEEEPAVLSFGPPIPPGSAERPAPFNDTAGAPAATGESAGACGDGCKGCPTCAAPDATPKIPDDLDIERLLDAVLDASYVVEQTEGNRTEVRRAFDAARQALLDAVGRVRWRPSSSTAPRAPAEPLPSAVRHGGLMVTERAPTVAEAVEAERVARNEERAALAADLPDALRAPAPRQPSDPATAKEPRCTHRHPDGRDAREAGTFYISWRCTLCGGSDLDEEPTPAPQPRPAHLPSCSPAGCAPGCPYRGEDAGAIGEGSIA